MARRLQGRQTRLFRVRQGSLSHRNHPARLRRLAGGQENRMGWTAHEGEKRAGSRPVRPSQVSQRVDIVSRLAMQTKIRRLYSRPFVGAVLAVSLALRCASAENKAEAEPREIDTGPPP